MIRYLIGDNRVTLPTLADKSVHCCVTSPPYFNLRNYNHPDQIGLEATPAEYVAEMVGVFEQVRRVLRDDGTLWLNLGDSYCGKPPGCDGVSGSSGLNGIGSESYRDRLSQGCGTQIDKSKIAGLKPKDLIGIPWMVAFALREAGWYLRQDIIWEKPSPMPESVRDRCTKAHEYLFLLAKSPRYYYDAEAIKEKAAYAGCGRPSKEKGEFVAKGEPLPGQLPFRAITENRNRRSVWTIASQPYSGAHFAVMPPKLIEPCILAGTSEHGCCPACFAPWQRVVERTKLTRERPNAETMKAGVDNTVAGVAVKTIGWEPTCGCGRADVVPCTVMDPFGGAGTTGLVASRHGRDAILCELNPDYAEMARRRIEEDEATRPLFLGA